MTGWPAVRSLLGPLLVLVLLLTALAAPAQEAPLEEEWQSVITSQVEAFRTGDAAGALSFAGAGFQTRFTSPEAFFVAIMSSGYAPIMQSLSHSFGSFQQLDPARVAQVVTFTGPDQDLYQAIYILTREDAGWRVEAVQLARTGAVGV